MSSSIIYEQSQEASGLQDYSNEQPLNKALSRIRI